MTLQPTTTSSSSPSTWKPTTFAHRSCGSLALDALLTRSYIWPGKTLRLCGGEPHLQRQLLLGFCAAAIARGESAVYLDFEGTLRGEEIERAGLADALGADDSGNGGAPFRVVRPEGFEALRPEMNAIASGESAPVPGVVVVDGLHGAVFDSLERQPQTQQEEWSLAARVMGALSGAACARNLGEFTLWIAHSPKVKRAGGGMPGAYSGKVAGIVRPEVRKECEGGIEIGDVQLLTMDSLRVAVKALDYRGRVEGEGTFELWQNGRFKND